MENHGNVFGVHNRRNTIAELRATRRKVAVTEILQRSLANLWKESTSVLSRSPMNGENVSRKMVYNDLSRLTKKIDSTLASGYKYSDSDLELTLHEVNNCYFGKDDEISSLADHMTNVLKVVKRLSKVDAVRVEAGSSVEADFVDRILGHAIEAYVVHGKDRRLICRVIGDYLLEQQPHKTYLIIAGDVDKCGWYIWFEAGTQMVLTLGDLKIFIGIVKLSGENSGQNRKCDLSPVAKLIMEDRLTKLSSDILSHVSDQPDAEPTDVPKQIADGMGAIFGESFECIFGPANDRLAVYFASASLSSRCRPKFDVRLKITVKEEWEVHCWRMS